MRSPTCICKLMSAASFHALTAPDCTPFTNNDMLSTGLISRPMAFSGLRSNETQNLRGALGSAKFKGLGRKSWECGLTNGSSVDSCAETTSPLSQQQYSMAAKECIHHKCIHISSHSIHQSLKCWLIFNG